MTDEARLQKLQQLFEHLLRDPDARRDYLGSAADAFREDTSLSALSRMAAERAIAQGLSNEVIDRLAIPELRTDRNYNTATRDFLENPLTRDILVQTAQQPERAAESMFSHVPTRADIEAPAGTSASSAGVPLAQAVEDGMTAELDEPQGQQPRIATKSPFDGLFGEISEADRKILSGETRFKKNINLDDNGIRLLIASRPDLLEFPAFVHATHAMADGEWKVQKKRYDAQQKRIGNGEALAEDEEVETPPHNDYERWVAEKMATQKGREELQRTFKQTSPLLPHEGDPLGAGFVSFRRDYGSMMDHFGRGPALIMVDQKGTEYFNYGNRTEVKLKGKDQFEPRHAMNVVSELIQERAELVEDGKVKDFNITLRAWGIFSNKDAMGHQILASLTQADRTGCMEAMTIKTKQGRFGALVTRDQIDEESIPASVRAQYPDASRLIKMYNERKAGGLEAEVETPDPQRISMPEPEAIAGGTIHLARRPAQPAP